MIKQAVVLSGRHTTRFLLGALFLCIAPAPAGIGILITWLAGWSPGDYSAPVLIPYGIVLTSVGAYTIGNLILPMPKPEAKTHRAHR